MRCYGCNKIMLPNEGVKAGKTISLSWIYYCAECAPNPKGVSK